MSYAVEMERADKQKQRNNSEESKKTGEHIAPCFFIETTATGFLE